MNEKFLRIYLQDHLAGSTAGVELARRTRGANEGTEYGPPLAKIADEIEADRRQLERIIDDLGFGADRLKATKAPMFFIHGDADGVLLGHISEMFRLKGDEIHGDLRPRSASRLSILPNTTHVTLMERRTVIVPMVNDFLDAKQR